MRFIWLGLSAGFLVGQTAVADEGSTKNATLWYRQPAERFVEGLPLGNGHVGHWQLESGSAN